MSFGIIYCAYNKINNKRYVGQTIHDLKKRIRHHYSDFSACVFFHRALKKYPKKYWEWKIIDSANNQEELDLKEKFWIKFFNTTNCNNGYNLTEGGQGSKGIKISDSHKRKTRETMIKVKDQNKKRNIQKSSPIKCVETGECYFSSVIAAKKNNINYSSIRRSIKTGCTAGKKHWVLLEGKERLKYIPNAFYCFENKKIYETIAQARIEDRFHEGNLSAALNNGSPYEIKKYAGYTFKWINPEYHINKNCVEFSDYASAKQIC